MKKFFIMIFFFITTITLVYSAENNIKINKPVKNKLISFNFNKTADNFDLINKYKQVKTQDSRNTSDVDERNSIGFGYIYILLFLGGILSLILILSSLISSIVFSALYASNSWEEKYARTGMFAAGSVFFSLICIFLMIIDGIKIFSIAPAIIGLISIVLAVSALIPAAILTYLYTDNTNRTPGLVTGIFWAWGLFGTFILPGIFGLILGIVAVAAQRKLDNDNIDDEENLSLDIRGNEIGIRYRF